MAEKRWGKHQFWGVGYDFDPQWCLTEHQKQLQEKLIELCRTKLRPNAIISDRTYEYPRANLNALAELGLLGLIVPKSLGGLGENHVCASMVVETIARYGCPSTAMVYVMHLGACGTLLFRYHNQPKLQDLLSRLDKDKLVGTLSYSDPATGGHFWFPISSKVRDLDDGTVKILKYGSWATSAGFADWYAIQTISPGSQSDYSNLSVYLVYKSEIRASTDDWSALGMHGNQSGPLIVEGVFNKDRQVGPSGDGALSNDEIVDPFFLLLSSCCWNGISMGAIDVAKKHVTRKAHADVGIRVCDYPTIQDYFGECVCETNMCRLAAFNMAAGMDAASNNNDFALHADLTYAPRSAFLHWLWQMKFSAAKNVDEVVDAMLHACGGTGYKTDLGIERLLRDGKAGWVMGPSNEVLRQFVGKATLLGMDTVDFWEKQCNYRVLHHELQKLTPKQKQEIATSLMEDAKASLEGEKKTTSYQDQDFDNPFNTEPPLVNDKVTKTGDGKEHGPGLSPTEYKKLKLIKKTNITDNMSSFVFALPKSTDHLGCITGQYVQVRIPEHDGFASQERYFSPVSHPDRYGEIELVLRFETQGILSQYFKKIQPGNEVELRGPMGGFEYSANSTDGLVLLASGGGITPCMQLLRTIMSDPTDKTKVMLLYYSETIDDILFKEEIDKYEKADSRLEVIHSLGEAPEGWEGEEGFLDETMIKKYVPTGNGKKYKVLMCGGPTMVLSLLYALKHTGTESSQIYVFGPFGTEQMRMVFGRNCTLGSHKSSA